ncbi:peptidyl-prolyl cis-trans isomerase G [Sarcoptes scabiei]|nr:peptidyl-prolyl cis-trans isomerase G [Sarcoptes scabiei]
MVTEYIIIPNILISLGLVFPFVENIADGTIIWNKTVSSDKDNVFEKNSNFTEQKEYNDRSLFRDNHQVNQFDWIFPSESVLSNQSSSKYFMNIFRQPNVQTHLKNNNPNLFQYLAKKDEQPSDRDEDNYRAIHNQIHNETEMNTSADNFKNHRSIHNPISSTDYIRYSRPSLYNDNFNRRKLEHFDLKPQRFYESSSFRHLQQEQDEDHFESETQTANDHETSIRTVKDLISSNNADSKVSDNKFAYKPSHYVADANGNYYDPYSCCEQLMNRYNRPKISPESYYLVARPESPPKYPITFTTFTVPTHPVPINYPITSYPMSPQLHISERYNTNTISNQIHETGKIPTLIKTTAVTTTTNSDAKAPIDPDCLHNAPVTLMNNHDNQNEMIMPVSLIDTNQIPTIEKLVQINPPISTINNKLLSQSFPKIEGHYVPIPIDRSVIHGHHSPHRMIPRWIHPPGMVLSHPSTVHHRPHHLSFWLPKKLSLLRQKYWLK